MERPELLEEATDPEVAVGRVCVLEGLGSGSLWGHRRGGGPAPPPTPNPLRVTLVRWHDTSQVGCGFRLHIQKCLL